MANRDILAQEFALLSAIANAAMERSTRVTRSELVTKLMLSIPDIQRQIDDTARKRRELDVLIQSINWATEM